MQENFGINGMMFEVQTIMAEIDGDEPTQYVEFVPTEGSLIDYSFIIGDFKDTGVVNQNGDAQISCNIVFKNKSKDENEFLITENTDILNTIISNLIKSTLE